MSQDPLKDQIIDLVNSITARVQSIDAALARIEDLDESLCQQGTRCEIEAGMGSVVVDGNGRLVGVHLNADSFGTGDTSKLGARVVKAILMAQASARTARDAHIDRLAREMWD